MRLNGLWTHGEDLARIFDWWVGACARKIGIPSLWDGAHDARLTGDVVDEILGGKVDRADWSGVPDDPRTVARPRHNSSAPYRAFSFVVYAGRRWKSAPRFLNSCVLSFA